jgi:hypothetical protein
MVYLIYDVNHLLEIVWIRPHYGPTEHLIYAVNHLLEIAWICQQYGPTDYWALAAVDSL